MVGEKTTDSGRRDVKYDDFTIHELEKELSRLQKSKTKNKEEVTAINLAIHNRLRGIKERAMNFEQSNNRYILLFASSQNFYKMAGNSVLFYAQDLSSRLGRRVEPRTDRDDYFSSEFGTVSIRDLTRLTKQFQELGILLDEEKSDNELLFFKVKRAYSKLKINQFAEAAKRDAQDLINLISTENPLPELYLQINELDKNIYYSVHRISSKDPDCQTGGQLIKISQEIIHDYFCLAKTVSEPDLRYSEYRLLRPAKPGSEPTSATTFFLAQIIARIGYIQSILKHIENVKMMQKDDIRKISLSSVTIEKIATREYGRQRYRDKRALYSKSKAKTSTK